MALPASSNDGPSHPYLHHQSWSTSSSVGREQQHSYASNDYYSSTQYLTHRHQRTAVRQNGSDKAPNHPAVNSKANNDDDKYGKKTVSDLEAPKAVHRYTNAALLASALLSAALIAWGYFLAFHTHPVQTIFRCEPQGCTYRETHDNGDHSVLHLHRHQIMRSELVRLDRRTGDVVEFLTGPRKGKSIYSSTSSRIVPDRKPSMFDPCPHTYVTYSLVFLDEEDHHMDLYHEYKQHSNEYLMVPHSKEPEDQTSTILFRHLDLTNAHLDKSNSQRNAFNQLKHYIAGKRTHVRLEELHYDGTLIGFKVMTVGVVLICITLIMWQWTLFKKYRGKYARVESSCGDITVADGDHVKDDDDSEISHDTDDDTDSENEDNTAK